MTVLTGLWFFILTAISWSSWVVAVKSIHQRDQDGTTFFGMHGWVFGCLSTLIIWDQFLLIGSHIESITPEPESMLHYFTALLVFVVVLGVWFFSVPASTHVFYKHLARKRRE